MQSNLAARFRIGLEPSPFAAIVQRSKSVADTAARGDEMAGIGTITRDLSRLRGRWRDLMASAGKGVGTNVRGDDAAPWDEGGLGARFGETVGFGSNPGALRMFAYRPEGLGRSPALVLALHGCTQSAAGYALGSGWTALAERYGFLLVCPQQVRSNNQKSCFNWFLPQDTARDAGEALSIRQMVERAVQDHGVDRGRIFVTGLSAGGAMAAVMLATYPEVFAAGGIVAGLPYGAATNVQGALSAMFHPQPRSARAWGDAVRAASGHRGPWPRLSIWHGGADNVVLPQNGAELVKQWTDLHGLRDEASTRDLAGGHVREVWRDRAGTEVIESVTIAGMGHGTPLHAGHEEALGGTAGPFLLDVGIPSSLEMARFWGLADRTAQPARPARPRSAADDGGAALVSPDGSIVMPGPGKAAQHGRPPADVGSVISDALRAAGLMR